MALLNLRGTLILFLIFGQLLFPVHTLPLQAEEKVAESSSSTEATIEKKADKEEGVIGIATYYAKRYCGRLTSSGHRYNPKRFTAAHPTLPLGSKVKVVNLFNMKEVIVTVNDRCRKCKHELIDLSLAAAKQLGYIRKGIAKVRIIPLDEES